MRRFAKAQMNLNLNEVAKYEKEIINMPEIFLSWMSFEIVVKIFALLSQAVVLRCVGIHHN